MALSTNNRSKAGELSESFLKVLQTVKKFEIRMIETKKCEVL